MDTVIAIVTYRILKITSFSINTRVIVDSVSTIWGEYQWDGFYRIKNMKQSPRYLELRELSNGISI